MTEEVKKQKPWKVISSTHVLTEIEIHDIAEFKAQDGESDEVEIGSFLKITDDHDCEQIVVVNGYKIKDPVPPEPDQPNASFVLQTQPVGSLKNGKFTRGVKGITIPPTDVKIANDDDIKKMYAEAGEASFSFSKLVQSKNVAVPVDGDKFFSKHIAVVGSTGSGKSCTVAAILQEAVKKTNDQNTRGVLNNSHILIFDYRGEYPNAFPESNILSIKDLILPYWLMNSEELENMFIQSNELNSHNQVSVFKQSVILSKKKNNPDLQVDYDSPVFFDINEVKTAIHNHNIATKDANTHEPSIKSSSNVNSEYLFLGEIDFLEKVTGKVNAGPYNGEFHRFLSRIETTLSDDRLSFLFSRKKEDGTPYISSDFPEIIKQFIGYGNNTSNTTILDLSGLPFEVVGIVVSLVSRLMFDFAFHLKQLVSTDDQLSESEENREVPFLIVYEEAHNYVPREGGARYQPVKKAIERIAKEGRKYGITLMIVSQRPSEVSETIFSQCNNFVAMRLTNPTDQGYIQKLLPDSIAAITDSLPILEKREALIVGDSIPVPSIVEIDQITNKPNSEDVNFHTEWKKDWFALQVEKVVLKMKE